MFTSAPCYSPLVQAHTIFDLTYCGSFLRSAWSHSPFPPESKSLYLPCWSNSLKAQLTSCQTSAPRDSLIHWHLVNKVQPHQLQIQCFLCSVPNLCSFYPLYALTHNLQCSQLGISTIWQICLFSPQFFVTLQQIPQFVASHVPPDRSQSSLVHEIFSFPHILPDHSNQNCPVSLLDILTL